MEQEKFCQNCIYFKRYYVKNGTSFRSLHKGSCSHYKAIKKLRAKCDDDFICDNWEQSENILTDSEENVDLLLRTVYSNLNELSNIFRNK